MKNYKLKPRESINSPIEFSFDEDSQKIGGKDAATVKSRVDSAMADGYVSSLIPGVNFRIGRAVTLEVIGAVLNFNWITEEVLPLPKLPGDEEIPEGAAQ